ncbi:hypothetical protein [Lacrimispora brassicae]
MKKMMFLLLFSILLVGCSVKTTRKTADERGNRKAPYTIEEIGVYDGMEIDDKTKHYRAEITMKDVCRGDKAKEIYELGKTPYADSYEELVGDNKEMIVARFNFHVLETEGDQPVALSWDDITMFKLVSESGQTYTYFSTRQYIDMEDLLFTDLYEGGNQTGHLFYLVDKTDENPLIVFESKVNGGIWFKTVIPDKELGEDRIIAEDWIDPKKEKERTYYREMDKNIKIQEEEENKAKLLREKYAGSLNSPLPVSEWGVVSDRYEKCLLEFQVMDFMRGKYAKEYVAKQNLYDWKEGKELPEGKEFLAVHMKANIIDLSEEKNKNGVFVISRYNFSLIHSQTGKEYSSQDCIRLNYENPKLMLDHGSQNFWLVYLIDTSDAAPKLVYNNSSDKLFFLISEDSKLEDGKESYQSVYRQDEFAYDESQEIGSLYHPVAMGERKQISYKSKYDSLYDLPFSASLCILNGWRGKVAEEYYTLSSSSSDVPENMELIVLEVEVEVIETEGNNPIDFSSGSFYLFDGYGSRVDESAFYGFSMKEGLEGVYVGGKTKGYIGFLVPKHKPELFLTYKINDGEEKIQFFEIK